MAARLEMMTGRIRPSAGAPNFCIIYEVLRTRWRPQCADNWRRPSFCLLDPPGVQFGCTFSSSFPPPSTSIHLFPNSATTTPNAAAALGPIYLSSETLWEEFASCFSSFDNYKCGQMRLMWRRLSVLSSIIRRVEWRTYFAHCSPPQEHCRDHSPSTSYLENNLN